MCTLAVALSPHGPVPLLVAANRDEALDRPSAGPALRQGTVRYLAPRDERAQGTWLGLNARGLFVAVTNRFGGPPDPARRSRGALVTEALQAPSAPALRALLGALRPEAYNGFHLLYADARAGFITVGTGETLTHHALEPGLHVVTERSFGAGADGGRAERVRQAFRAAAVTGPEALEQLKPALTLHDDATRIGGSCLHVPERNYGTRSALLLALAGPRSRLLWAEGHPCEAPFLDRTALLTALELG